MTNHLLPTTNDSLFHRRLHFAVGTAEPDLMLIVHVHVHVKPESVDAFVAATGENARSSAREPGVVRFDVVQQEDDPTRFVLVEIYRTADDPARHKATAHYAAWRDAVEPMMAEPRRSVKYRALFPEAARWEMPAAAAPPR